MKKSIFALLIALLAVIGNARAEYINQEIAPAIERLQTAYDAKYATVNTGTEGVEMGRVSVVRSAVLVSTSTAVEKVSLLPLIGM